MDEERNSTDEQVKALWRSYRTYVRAIEQEYMSKRDVVIQHGRITGLPPSIQAIEDTKEL